MDFRESQALQMERTAKLATNSLLPTTGQSVLSLAATAPDHFTQVQIDPSTGEEVETDYFHAGDVVGSKPVRNSKR